MCSISGYGETGPYANMKAYDLLVQAESGLSSVTGTADGPIGGADGFGFVYDGDQHVRFPQVGRTTIGSNVDIGANACVDRGALDETVIQDGAKIDNLGQIAHNVRIGEHTE